MATNTLGEFSDGEDDFVFRTDDTDGVQTGRGEKRKNESDETESEDEQGQYYY